MAWLWPKITFMNTALNHPKLHINTDTFQIESPLQIFVVTLKFCCNSPQLTGSRRDRSPSPKYNILIKFAWFTLIFDENLPLPGILYFRLGSTSPTVQNS